MKSLKLLPTIANVAAGNTVSVNMPVGNTYETIYLYYTGATPAQLKNIKVELNGRMISEYPSGERLVSIDNHYKRNQTSGCLTFNFNRPELHVLGNQRFFGLDTNASQGIQTAIISLDIDAGAAATTLKAYAQVVQSVAGAPNYLTKVRRFIVPVSAAGQFDIDTIPKPIGANIAAIHLYMADGADGDALCDITKAEMLVDNVNWHDLPANIAANIQTANGRVPQVAESTVIDLILDGDITNALVLTGNIQDFRLRCEASGVGQVEIMVEYIDVWRAGGF
jgi:hypothetical protein